MKREIPFWSLHILVPLLLGGCIYLLCRPETYAAQGVLRLLNTLGLPALPYLKADGAAGRFLTNHLCDACWAYSLTFALAWAAGQPHLVLSTALAAALSAVYELWQLWNPSIGTFDPTDIIIEITACLLACGIIYRRKYS